MKKMSKGISPLVAAVLLIAVTMTIAGGLAYWASSIVETTLPQTNETEKGCPVMRFTVDDCKYLTSQGTVIIRIHNTGPTDMSNMKAFLIYPNFSVSDPYILNGSINSGILDSYAITGINDSFTKVVVNTQCSDKSGEKVCSIS